MVTNISKCESLDKEDRRRLHTLTTELMRKGKVLQGVTKRQNKQGEDLAELEKGKTTIAGVKPFKV